MKAVLTPPSLAGSWWPFGSVGNIAYVATRLRARKSKFLPSQAYHTLLAQDIHGITRYLQDHGYRQEIDEMVLSNRFDKVEVALRLNLERIQHEIVKMCSGQLKDLVQAYISRYDIQDVKTVVRAKYFDLPEEKVSRELVTASRPHAAFFKRLMDASTIEALIEELGGTIVYEELKAELSGTQTPQLRSLEDALDRAYYSNLLAAIPQRMGKQFRLFRDYIRLEIDLLNLATITRAKYHGAATEQLRSWIVPGGRVLVDRGLEALMSAPDFGSFQETLERHFPSIAGDLSAAYKEVVAEGNLFSFSLGLKKKKILDTGDYSRAHPVTIIPILDFIQRKAQEVNNLVSIVRGIESGLAREVIEQMLVI